MSAYHNAAPPLARALAALAHVQSSRESGVKRLVSTFTAVVAELDTADEVYRAAVGALLPSSKARETLAALTSFRAGVSEIRERARGIAGYADFDPLDTYMPALSGSHARGIKAASAADTARCDVAELRARVNERIAALLDRVEIERISEAKRIRNAAFDRIVRGALPPQIGDKLATQLLLLVDGWY